MPRLKVAGKTQSEFLSALLGTVARASDCVVAEGRPSPFHTLSPWPRFIMSGAFFGCPPTLLARADEVIE